MPKRIINFSLKKTINGKNGGRVTQLAATAEGKRFQNSIRKIQFALHSLPDNKANAQARAKLQQKLARLMK